eukprot:365990-Chlamydomonas_euryale.AAC.12
MAHTAALTCAVTPLALHLSRSTATAACLRFVALLRHTRVRETITQLPGVTCEYERVPTNVNRRNASGCFHTALFHQRVKGLTGEPGPV